VLKRLIIFGLIVALVTVMSAPAVLFATGSGGNNGVHGKGKGHCKNIDKPGHKKHHKGHKHHKHHKHKGHKHHKKCKKKKKDCDDNNNGIVTPSEKEYCKKHHHNRNHHNRNHHNRNHHNRNHHNGNGGNRVDD
jgi:hypothetical protein